jgi:hypothetical protein
MLRYPGWERSDEEMAAICGVPVVIVRGRLNVAPGARRPA